MQKPSIKVLFVILIAVTIILTGCGQKEKAERLARLQKADSTITALHELKYLYRNIYSGMLHWVYTQTDTRSKDALRSSTQIDYVVLKGQWQHKYGDVKEDVGFVEMDTLVDLAANAMGTVLTFEDYEDDVKMAEAIAFSERASAVFDALELRYHDILSRQDSLFETQVAGTDDADVQAIVNRHKRMRSYYEAEGMAWEIHTRTLSWLYRPEDFGSKAALKKDLDIELPALLSTLRQRLGLEGEHAPQASLLAARLDTLAMVSKQTIVANLQSKENYDDPLTMLLAEDAYETYMNPAYQEATQYLAHIREQIQNPGPPSTGQATPGRTMEAEMEALRRIVEEQKAYIKELEEENKKLRSADR